MPATVALYDTAAVRTLESRANAALGGERVLMQRAGEAAWRCVLAHWPQAVRLLVACGPGNNGGDGYVLATHALRAGREVRVLRLPGHALRPGPALEACRAYEAAGGVAGDFDGALPSADLVVDAVFGTGLSRAPEGVAAQLIAAIAAQSSPVLALDVPSGVDAERGDVPGTAVRATRTLQMLVPHQGLYTGAALDACGALELATLDVDPDGFDIAPSATALSAAALSRWLPRRARDSHKGGNGHVLCIGGDAGSGGAIALCAEAALRTGAGLVSVATRANHVASLLARRPEAMVAVVDEADALAPLLARASVIALGPGLGQQDWGHAVHARALDAGLPLVIDADALNLLAQASPASLREDTVLTPHPGEAARLLGIPTHVVQADRFAAARAIAERFGCVVVLKGAGTLVAAPDRRTCVIDAGNPGMATGGMGDVLTGVIAALRAQGLDAFDAACCGALLHACAGDVAARDGERGLLPSDLFAPMRRLANP